MKKVKIIITLLMIIAMLFILMPKSNAALQANGLAGTTQGLDSWLVNIRKMESLGGTLGLTETQNSALTSSNGSNNLDIHMIKNTEYGAIAILSASSYGNPNKIASGETTTGNETGIVIYLNKEWTAAGRLKGVSAFINANAKYQDVYGGTKTYRAPNYYLSYIPKIGDAIGETAGWHGSTSSSWFYVHNAYGSTMDEGAGVLRAYSGSIFSYYGYLYDWSKGAQDAYYTKAWHSRAIMVCGEGI